MFKNGKPAQNFPALYDEHINKTIPYFGALHIEIINIVNATGRKPELWLDTGCGKGTLAEKALDVFHNTRFLLSDPSEDMMNVARRKLDGKYGDRCRFLTASTTQDIILPGDECPDVITAVLCHHYLNEEGRLTATNKCFDLLEKGGLYITVENIRPFTVLGTEIGKSNWKNFQVAAGKPVDEVDNHIKRFGLEYFPITVNEHLSLLLRCGFSGVEMLWYSYMQAGFYCIK